MIPLGAILGYALFERETGASEAVTTSVAAVVTLIPEGLILLMSLTYAFAALRMTRRGALAQQLNAIESLASVDVICLDKTGTLTEPALRVVDYVPVAGIDRDFLAKSLRRFAASQPAKNATLDAIADALPGEAEEPSGHVPFLSSRRWSGVRVGALGLVLGAPEHFDLGQLGRRVAAEQDQGRRVVALGTTAARLRSARRQGPLVISSPSASSFLVSAYALTQPRPLTSSTVRAFRSRSSPATRRARSLPLPRMSVSRPRTCSTVMLVSEGYPASYAVSSRTPR